MRKLALSAASAMALLAASDAVEASGDFGCDARWTLHSPSYDCANRAVLSPGNDTRVNLVLLLRDRAGLASPEGHDYAPADYDNAGFGHVFFDWGLLQASYYRLPDEYPYGAYEGRRCNSLASGNEAFNTALMAARRLGEAERNLLIEARTSLAATCGASGETHSWPTGIGDRLTRDFLAYLAGADAFYAGRFDEARATFALLRKSRDPWVSETAAYMVARNELVAAQAPAFDEWGDYLGAQKTNKDAARRGQAALAAYLQAHPQGRYAASARGLQRRASWLLGDRKALGRAYGELLATMAADSEDVPRVVQEIDNKLLFAAGMRGTIDAPLLLATWDLQRMRVDGDLYAGASEPITSGEIAVQEPLFAGAPELFAFVRANHAFYVEHDYRKARDLLPDDARRASYAPLAFSRQVLRGLALETLGDRNAAGFWLELAKGAQDLYQRPAVELALTMNWERHGQLARVFAKDSPVHESEIRMILLEHSASDALLREQAKRADRPSRERSLALFMLLYKQLSRGHYGAFLGDLALVGGDATKDGYIGDWLNAEAPEAPVGLFARGTWSDGYACPALAGSVSALSRNPRDAGALLCLGEFYRLNGFDDYLGDDGRPAKGELGGVADEFGGTATARQSLYQRVIADPSASADDKAYALYRAVWCYGPSGNNDCGGEDVPLAQRKAWFQRLKREYPSSRWARSLKYYW